jgi:hypothetical protein
LPASQLCACAIGNIKSVAAADIHIDRFIPFPSPPLYRRAQTL